MNLWHYVEIENVELIDSISILIVSVILEKLRKIKINNLKIVTIMRNRLKCNDKNLLKDEINAKNAWKILKNSFSSFESKMLNDLLIKFWIITFVNNQDVTNYVRRFKMTMQNIREMIINVSINDNFLFCIFIWILTRSSSNIANIMFRFMKSCRTNRIRLKTSITWSIDFLIFASIVRFRRNQRSSWSSSLSFRIRFLTQVQSDAQSKIKNVVIIIVKMCIICEKKYHTASEHREQLNFKRDRNQFDEKRDDRDNKRRRKNDNDDDERFNSKIDDEEKKHKMYIIINLEILTIMSVMSRQIVYWVLNTICFQHNVRNRSTFIFYTTFSKFIFVNDLKNSTIAMK